VAEKHKNRSLIPKSASNNNSKTNYLNKNISKIESWQGEGNSATVFVSLRYLQDDFQCFSSWDRSEMKCFWDFNRKVHDYTWQNILEQGGKAGNKVGFGYTIIPRELYPNQEFLQSISPDANIFEMRASQVIRLHGFRVRSVFYVCWLDRNHEICV